MPEERRGAPWLAGCLAVALVILSGCRSEMYDPQPRYEPYEATEFFDDGTSARPLVAGTVPRRDPRDQGKWADELFTTGKAAGKLADALPFPVDRAVLEAAKSDSGSSARRAMASWAMAGA